MKANDFYLGNPKMEDEKRFEEKVGAMRKRTETMPDGKRYIIYYTFGGDEKTEPQKQEVKKNV